MASFLLGLMKDLKHHKRNRSQNQYEERKYSYAHTGLFFLSKFTKEFVALTRFVVGISLENQVDQLVAVVLFAAAVSRGVDAVTLVDGWSEDDDALVERAVHVMLVPGLVHTPDHRRRVEHRALE